MTERPVALEVLREGIPRGLQDLSHWVVWRYWWDGEDWRKPPHSAVSGQRVDVAHPENLTDFETAWQCYERERGSLSGLGFSFLSDGICGTDVDACRDPIGGAITDWGRAIINALNSYTEISPSGTGVKIFVCGVGPRPGRKRTLPNAKSVSDKTPAVEMYTGKRYFAVTGQHLAGTPDTIEPREAEFAALYERLFGAPASTGGADGDNGVVEAELDLPRSAGLNDFVLLQKARNARNGAKFKALFDEGEISDYNGDDGKPDDNRADEALVNLLLFWTADDLEQLDRLFRQSKLSRPKWTERPAYRASTIRRAARGRSRDNYYGQGGRASTEPEPPPPTVEFPTEVLPEVLGSQVQHAVERGLPLEYCAGAGLFAAASAIGAKSKLQLGEDVFARAIMYVSLDGEPGTGKTPSLNLMCRPLITEDIHRADVDEIEISLFETARANWKRGQPRPVEPKLRSFIEIDATMEAIARKVKHQDGVVLLLKDAGSLLTLIGGEYKGHATSADEARVLRNWDGDGFKYTRVGSGGGTFNAVRVHAPDAAIGIIICVQPALRKVLGTETSGMRGRWCVHHSDQPALDDDEDSEYAITLEEWRDLLNTLIGLREQERVWVASPAVRRRIRWWGRAWKRRAREASQSASASNFLDKAESHLQRLVLVCLEIDSPGAGGILDDVALVDRCATWIEYCANIWNVLGDGGPLPLSHQDVFIDAATQDLITYLEGHGGFASKRALQRGPSRFRHKPRLETLLKNLAAINDQCVRPATVAGGTQVWICAPSYPSRPGVVWPPENPDNDSNVQN